MPLTKYEGSGYPTHFLKIRGSLIRNNFLEYGTSQATIFEERNDFHALFATNKANIYSIGFFRVPVEKQFKVKV